MDSNSILAPSWRECRVCLRILTLDAFVKAGDCRYGRTFECRPCKGVRTRGWNRENRQRQKHYSRKWNVANPERRAKLQRNSKLKAAYGITSEDYDRMYAEQAGVCAICALPETVTETRTGVVKNLCVDHCHATGQVRALLCFSCNLMIGQAGDSTDRLRSAINYLEIYGSQKEV